MPIEDWIQHSKAAQFLYDWQTLAAGILAARRVWPRDSLMPLPPLLSLFPQPRDLLALTPETSAA